MNNLTSIPFAVRRTMYWTAYVLGNVSSVLAIFWGAVAAASPGVEMPVWLTITGGVVTLMTTQLHGLAIGNMPSVEDVVDGDVEIVDGPRHRAG